VDGGSRTSDIFPLGCAEKKTGETCLTQSLTMPASKPSKRESKKVIDAKKKHCEKSPRPKSFTLDNVTFRLRKSKKGKCSYTSKSKGSKSSKGLSGYQAFVKHMWAKEGDKLRAMDAKAKGSSMKHIAKQWKATK
jgi:ribosomal protein L22